MQIYLTDHVYPSVKFRHNRPNTTKSSKNYMLALLSWYTNIYQPPVLGHAKWPVTIDLYSIERIGGVMSAVAREFEGRSGQTKDYEIGICYFSIKHAALRKKSKD